MFIVPFIYKETKQPYMTVHAIQILTIGGRELWEEANGLCIDTEVLEPNELYHKGPVYRSKHLHLCEVDTERTVVNDFYRWKELGIEDRETFCWRDFYYFVGEKKESWLDIPLKETLSEMPIAHVIEDILRAKKVI